MFRAYAPIVSSNKFRQAAYGILQYKERKFVSPLCGGAHLLLRVRVCEECCLDLTKLVIGRSWLPGCMVWGGLVGDVCSMGERCEGVVYIRIGVGCTCVMF
jgi:hypothetical protein